MQINYKECLNEWQDSVTNALTMRAIYDKVPFQSRGHSLKVKDEHNEKRLQLCVNNMTEEYQELSKIRKAATDNSTFTIMEGMDQATKLRRAMGK